MKVYENVKDCPPVTKEQRDELVKRVREGRLNWINSLMKRASITPEECVTPSAKFPVDLILDLMEKGYEVNTHYYNPKASPIDLHRLHFLNYAIAHGIERSTVVEYIKYDKEFGEKLLEIQEQAIQGVRQFAITEEDLKPLED